MLNYIHVKPNWCKQLILQESRITFIIRIYSTRIFFTNDRVTCFCTSVYTYVAQWTKSFNFFLSRYNLAIIVRQVVTFNPRIERRLSLFWGNQTYQTGVEYWLRTYTQTTCEEQSDYKGILRLTFHRLDAVPGIEVLLEANIFLQLTLFTFSF